jgi:DNA-binding beta-propeller fold protein YncE
LGDWEGRIPRRIAAYDGNVYFTTSSGYVAAIDTINFALQQKYQVGPSPEGLAFDVNSSTLYVANSDVGYGNGSISKIDITSGNATEIRHDKVKYPQEIAVAGDVLYVLDGGYYTDDWSEQVDAGVYMVNNYDAQLMVPNATGMAAIGDMIYTYNDPLGGSGATYSIFDIRSNNLSTLNLSGDSAHRLVSPCAINVDQVTGYIYIASRQLDPDTGYPSKTMPGFVNIYSNSGQFMESFETGIEPHKIEFNHYLSWNGVY